MKTVVLIRSTPVRPDPPVEKMANTLSKMGYKVVILAWDRDSDYPIETEIDDKLNITTVRFGIKAEFGGGLKKTLFKMIKFQNRLNKWLKDNHNSYDIIHAFDFDTGLAALRAASKYKKKLVYHILDYYVDSHGLRGGRLEKIVCRFENNVINKADAVIICTDKRKEQISGSNPKSLFVIHNTPSGMKFDEGFELKSQNDLVKIAYVGILADGRALDMLLEYVRSNDNVELHIGGFGPMADDIQLASETYKNIHYYGKLQYSSTLALENKCDIMVAIYDPSVPNHKYSAPNKFYESLMLGKPIIMAKNTGFDEIILQNKIGCCIEYSIEGLKDGIDFLTGNVHNWNDMGSRSKALYDDMFSWEVMEDRIADIYKSIE